MQTKFVKVAVDLHCDWQGLPPVYRLFVNGELFSERTFLWEDPVYLTEVMQVKASPGEYRFRIETVGPQMSNFTVKNPRILFGPGKILPGNRFEINED